MAVVSLAPAITQHVNPISFCEGGVPGIMAARGGVVKEPVARIIEDKIYVAVGKIVRDSKSVLLWALQNSGGKRICIVHVHQPTPMIPFLGTRLPVSSVEEKKVKACWEIERQRMHEILNKYLRICQLKGSASIKEVEALAIMEGLDFAQDIGYPHIMVESDALEVRAEKIYIERDCIEKGILELISLHGIRKLFMGAAADKHYSRRMTDVKSKKAISVRQGAPATCQIWFVCKGQLIYPREGISNGTISEVASSSPQASANTVTGQSNYLRSRSTVLGRKHHVNLANSTQGFFRRTRSLNFGRQVGRENALYSSDNVAQPSTPHSKLDTTEGSSDESDVASMSTSEASFPLPFSSSRLVNMDILQLVTTEESENGSAIGIRPQSKVLCEELHLSLGQKSLLENQISESDHNVKELEQKGSMRRLIQGKKIKT